MTNFIYLPIQMINYSLIDKPTHPPKVKYISYIHQTFFKKFFSQNFTTHYVCEGVDHSISRPPIQFERLGYSPTLLYKQLQALKLQPLSLKKHKDSFNLLYGTQNGNQSFYIFYLESLSRVFSRVLSSIPKPFLH
jgi:hypothetical protein